jgi:hypothetical protein
MGTSKHRNYEVSVTAFQGVPDALNNSVEFKK